MTVSSASMHACTHPHTLLVIYAYTRTHKSAFARTHKVHSQARTKACTTPPPHLLDCGGVITVVGQGLIQAGLRATRDTGDAIGAAHKLDTHLNNTA